MALASCAASWFACRLFTLDVWPALILNAAVSFLVPNLIYFAVYGRNHVFRESLSQLKRSIMPGNRKTQDADTPVREGEIEE